MFLAHILAIIPSVMASVLLFREPREGVHFFERSAVTAGLSLPTPIGEEEAYSGSAPQIVSNFTTPNHKRIINMGRRCGPDFGRCRSDLCCSLSGYCGNTPDHCRSPDCQIDYGVCDASKIPQGEETLSIPRPHTGVVPYGPKKIFSCTVPGAIALTYDDGPNIYTHDLLDILDSYDAKATFFISGINSGKGQIDDFSLPWGFMIQRMHYDGHQIASHSWSHQDLSKISKTQRLDQILKNEAALRNILGGFPTYARPPYSSCTEESGCLDDLDELGYHIIYFDVDTDDYNNDHPEQIQRSKDIFDRALASRRSVGRSLLTIAHDVHEQTVHNLTQHILREISDAGYRAITLGECLNDPKELWYRWDTRPVV